MTAPAPPGGGGVPPLTGWPLWWRLLVIGGLWGSTFPVLRHAAMHLDPWWLAAARALLATLAIWAWLLWSGRGGGLGRGAFLRHAAVLGTLNGWLPNLLASAALARVESAPAALIQSASPLMVAALAALALPGERPGRRAVAGLLVGFVGVAVIAGPDALEGRASAVGAALMLLVALSYAGGTVYTRAARPGAADRLVLGQQVVSFLGAAAIGLALAPGGPPVAGVPPSAWAAVAVLAVLGSALPLTMFLSLVQRARTTDATMVGYLQPAFAAVAGAILLSEWPEPRALAGGAVVLAGVWLATTTTRGGR